jgi:P-type conjugative transfer protein TrbJ
MKKTWLSLIVVMSVVLAPAAHAQWAVFDAANFSQNILTAARELQQVDNQIIQLQNESTMLENEARNLKSLDFNSLSQILNLLSSTDRLLAQAQGLAFNVTQMDTQFVRLYPQSYPASTTGSQMAADAQTRWSYSLSALQTAMQLQAQAVENVTTDESTLSSLGTQSQSAVGELQATQATNQLLALQARESLQGQELRLTQDRATSLEQARAVAAQARALVVRQQFVGNGPQYTPQPVSFYGN